MQSVLRPFLYSLQSLSSEQAKQELQEINQVQMEGATVCGQTSNDLMRWLITECIKMTLSFFFRGQYVQSQTIIQNLYQFYIDCKNLQ